MKECPYFAFIDESGTLANDKQQKFFSIGLLLIEDTAQLTHEISIIRQQMISSLKLDASKFEFKFNKITKRSKEFYIRLIDEVLKHPVKICVFVLDKTDPEIDYEKHFKSTWDAYIWYTKLLINKNVEKEKPCVLIMDYLGKPRNNPRFIESEVKTLPEVLNATMLESESANLIQAIDVITGCVTYEFRRRNDPSLIRDKIKRKVVDYLKMKLGTKEIARNFSVNDPCYFHVWPFSPK